MIKWESRSKILSNLLNPAFCGEVLKRFILGYNDNSKKNVSYSHIILVLPIILNKSTRDNLPRTTKSHLFTWIDDNEHLFIDFGEKVKDMLPYTKESIMFLKLYNSLDFDSSGNIYVKPFKKNLFKGEEDVEEINEILKKAEFLGKWFSNNDDVKSLYSFLKIVP